MENIENDRKKALVRIRQINTEIAMLEWERNFLSDKAWKLSQYSDQLREEDEKGTHQTMESVVQELE